MDLLYSTLYSEELSVLVSSYLQNYRQLLLLMLLVIALLNCFLGFHFRKLWGILAGMMLGAAAAAGVCLYIKKTGMILYIAVILGAFTLGLLALLLYRVGLFFICVLLVPLILGKLFPAQKLDTVFLWILLGISAGILTLVREREIISTITSLGGGFGSAKLLLMLQEHDSFMILLLAGLALSITGLFLQFQPWRPRSAWNSDEERVRDKHRHKRRMKRIQRKRKLQERKEQKKHIKPSVPRRTPVSGTKTGTAAEYTPYTTHPIYQASLKQRSPDPSAAGKTTYPEAELPAASDESPKKEPTSPVEPDLSDIRLSISREVSDIYQEQKKDMDETLNRLLEQEYHTTTRRLDRTDRHRRRR